MKQRSFRFIVVGELSGLDDGEMARCCFQSRNTFNFAFVREYFIDILLHSIMRFAVD